MRAALAALALTLAAAASAAAGDARPVAYTVRDAAAIDAPLTDAAADAARGAALFVRHCAACHADAAGLAGPEASALRVAVVNLGVARPDAAEHAFYDLPPFDPDAERMPETRLTALEIEDILAHIAAAKPNPAPDAGRDETREGDRP